MKGCKNCHTMGVDSVILKEGPPLVRAFIASKDHDLWKNQPGFTYSVGFHPHHCDVGLTLVEGQIWNVEPLFRTNPDAGSFRRYLYDSVLMGGKGGFKRDQVTFDVIPFNRHMAVGVRLPLIAKALHTIYVPQGQEAIWIVDEGKEDGGFVPTCYSNAKLEKWTSAGLYQPMTDEEVEAMAARVYSLR